MQSGKEPIYPSEPKEEFGLKFQEGYQISRYMKVREYNDKNHCEYKNKDENVDLNRKTYNDNSSSQILMKGFLLYIFKKQ